MDNPCTEPADEALRCPGAASRRPPGPEIARLAAVLLHARFGPIPRPPCPRCRAARVHRWGSFAGRRRFRCSACGRTFSDFTGTPVYRSHYPERWRAYARCVRDRLSVRAAARELDIHKDTAWRWRQALLAALLDLDREPLTGEVELGSGRFPHSAKGERRLWRRPYRLGQHPSERPTIRVLFARDAASRTLTRVLPPGSVTRPRAEELGSHLLPRLRRPCILRAPWGGYGPTALLCRRLQIGGAAQGLRHQLVAPTRLFVDYRLAILRWLRPFHGISSRYIERYLVWFRVADPGEADGAARRLLFTLASG